jgi:arylsulfatase A-like enzyme
MKVPMFAYWKGHIPPGQVIQTPISTLDFTATTLKLAGGDIPAKFDGVDILPYLMKKTSELVRTKDLFWDWGDGIALQKDGWKIHRFGKRLALFNIKDDPNEFYDLRRQHPEKFQEMEAALMARYNALPENGRSPLRGAGRGNGDSVYVTGASADTRSIRAIAIPTKKTSRSPIPLL